MKARRVKVSASYVAYHTGEFVCHLAYGSMHCVANLLSHLNINIEIGYLGFLLHYVYFFCTQSFSGWKVWFANTPGLHTPPDIQYPYYFVMVVILMISYVCFADTMVRFFTVNPVLILKYKQFLFFWEKQISDKMIEMKRKNYSKRLMEIQDLPVQIISEIINFIEDDGIQSKLHLKTFVHNDIFRWRCKCNPNTIEMTKVRRGFQADVLGVKVGWIVKHINGKPLFKLKYKEFTKETSLSGKGCDIMFKEPFIHPIRRPLEMIALVLFRILFALLFRLAHDVLYYSIFISWVNPWKESCTISPLAARVQSFFWENFFGLPPIVLIAIILITNAYFYLL